MGGKGYPFGVIHFPMFIENIVTIKKQPLIDLHGESCNYQVIWQDDDHGRL